MTRLKHRNLVWYVVDSFQVYIFSVFLSYIDVTLSFCSTQPQELVNYTGYSHAKIFKAAEFVASKVSEVVKTQKDRRLVAVKRKYAGKIHRHISTDFESPDAVDILDD